MAILKNLLVSGGASRFLGTTYFQDVSIVGTASLASLSLSGALTVNGTTTLKGATTINNTMVVSKLSTFNGIVAKDQVELYGSTPYIDFHFGNSSTDRTSRIIESVSGTLNVENNLTVANKLSAPEIVATNISTENLRWAKLEEITVADLGGTFIVAPTIFFTEGQTSVHINNISGKTVTMTITCAAITSDTLGGHTWSQYSKVKLSGMIGGCVLGSCDGYLSAKLNTTEKTANVIATIENASLLSSGTTYSGANVKNLAMMMYAVGNGSQINTNKVGMVLTSYGDNYRSYLDIYGGTSNQSVARVGNLGGLTFNGETLDNQWGILTSNGYFDGTIISNEGRIGGWTIDANKLYNGTDSMTSTAVGTYIGAGSSAANSGIRNYASATQYVNITGGKITALGADIRGEITATSGSIAGWRIEPTYLASGAATHPAANVLLLSPAGTSSSYTVAGTAKSGWMITAGTKFGVNKDGGVYAELGEIGGWTLDDSSLYTGTKTATSSIIVSSADVTRDINGASRTGLRLVVGSNFGVSNTGVLYANSANISGILSAGANSTIGPWTVSTTSIWKGSATFGDTTSGSAYFGNDGLSIGGLLKVDVNNGTLSLGQISQNNTSSNISISSSGVIINKGETPMAAFNTDGIKLRGSDEQILLDINTIGEPTLERDTYSPRIYGPFENGTIRVIEMDNGMNDHFDNFSGDGVVATIVNDTMVDYITQEQSFSQDFSTSCLNGKATLNYSYTNKTFTITFNSSPGADYVDFYFEWVYTQYPSSYTFGTRDTSHNKGNCSTTIGKNLINENANALVVGQYNSDDNYLFAIGNGTSALHRSNAFTVDNYGVVGFSGVAMFGDPSNTFYVTSHTVVNNASVASLNYKEGTITIERAGYYPLCVAGYNSNTRYLTPTRFYLSDQQSGSGSLHYMIFNPTSSARTGTCTMWVMWVKTI